MASFELSGLRILSDLHIYSAEDPLYRDLIRWLKATPEGSGVALLGDVFDVWVGDSAFFREKYSAFFEELVRLKVQGSKVIYVEGNHDFLMQKTFSDLENVNLVNDECETKIGESRIYLAHGDLANREDRQYLKLRSFFRSSGFQKAVNHAPGSLIAKIGSSLSRYSRAKNETIDDVRSPEAISEMRSIYRNFALDRFRSGFDHVVLGHCHDADEYETTVDERNCSYYNVGFPRKHRSYIEYDASRKALVRKPL